MDDLYNNAIRFATRAHRNQTRKYTGEPYILHPLSVAEIVQTVDHTQEMLAAAVLHDTVEDTEVTLDQIKTEFGNTVANYVEYLTDVSKPSDGNRAVRKNIDSIHYSRGPKETQTIKLADIIDNSKSIKQYDPRFWEIYKTEIWVTINRLTNADQKLWIKTRDLIKELW